MKNQVDWVKIYNQIDEVEVIKTKGGFLQGQENTQEYVDQVSYSLTIEKLKSFREATRYLNKEKVLSYIKEMSKEPPKPNGLVFDPDSEAENRFNNIAYIAKTDFYEFLKAYSVLLAKPEKYRPKEVAIAYRAMNRRFDESNYIEVLSKHSEAKSKKILQNPIKNLNDLSRTGLNKTADSKHLKSLVAAKRLVIEEGDFSAAESLEAVIQSFKRNQEKEYRE